MIKKRYIIILGIIAALICTYLGVWASVLLAKNPLDHPLSRLPIWPVACTLRGCITTTSWQEQQSLGVQFSTATKQPTPTLENSLTSAIRKHLVKNALLRSPVKLSDVQRYREEILHITNETDLQRYLTYSLSEYDSSVLLPFLQQEALKVQLKVETTPELYKTLNDQRPVFLLLLQYDWDPSQGAVTAKE